MEEQQDQLNVQQDQEVLPKLAVPDTAPRDTFNGTAIFDVSNTSIYYGSFRAVTDVSLTVYENEITAFIGPSGCGKTTVLRSLNRMNDLIAGARVEGDIRYRGVPLYGSDVSPTAVRRRIGMVFQKANPFPKSVYDNVAYGPRINGIRNKGKLDEIVERSLKQAALWDEVKDRLTSLVSACPAARRSGSASPARSRWSRMSCSWTSPARPSTRSRRAASRTS